MTWCVGIITTKEAILYADTQVTFPKDPKKPDSKEIYQNMLQKIYPMGQGIYVAFAGSIKIGFELIDNLKIALTLPADKDPQKHYWKAPLTIIRRWTKRTPKEIFEKAPENEKRQKAHLLIVGVTPTPDGFYKPFMVKIKLKLNEEPDITITEKPNSLYEIGYELGQKDKEYRSYLPTKEEFEILSLYPEPFSPPFNSPGIRLISKLTLPTFIKPIKGVSDIHHYMVIPTLSEIVYVGRVYGDPSILPEKKLHMPKMCTSYEEFKDGCKNIGFKIAGASW